MTTITAPTTAELLKRHHCAGVALRCIDFRFRPDTDRQLSEELENFDGPLAWAGGAWVLTQEGPARTAILEQLQISHSLHFDQAGHTPWRVALLSHTDCGLYKKLGFVDADEQRVQQEQDFAAARAFLQKEFPEADILCLLAVDDGTTINLERV